MSVEADNLLQDTKRQCVRIDVKGDKVVEHRDETVVNMWQRFNVDFRPESALFVDGACVHVGSHTQAACEGFSSQLRETAKTTQAEGSVAANLLAALQ